MAMSLTASVASFVPALNPVGLFSRFSEGVSRHIDFLMTPHPEHWNLFFVNWTVQFVASWVAFTIYIVWDYKNYKANKVSECPASTVLFSSSTAFAFLAIALPTRLRFLP